MNRYATKKFRKKSGIEISPGPFLLKLSIGQFSALISNINNEQRLSGQRLVGVWNESLKSPACYRYLAHILFGIGTNLSPTSIEFHSVTLPNANMPNIAIDNMSWQQYKNALSAKYGAWGPTSTVGVEQHQEVLDGLLE